jgi:hypothetical protein
VPVFASFQAINFHGYDGPMCSWAVQRKDGCFTKVLFQSIDTGSSFAFVDR